MAMGRSQKIEFEEECRTITVINHGNGTVEVIGAEMVMAQFDLRVSNSSGYFAEYGGHYSTEKYSVVMKAHTQELEILTGIGTNEQIVKSSRNHPLVSVETIDWNGTLGIGTFDSDDRLMKLEFSKQRLGAERLVDRVNLLFSDYYKDRRKAKEFLVCVLGRLGEYAEKPLRHATPREQAELMAEHLAAAILDKNRDEAIRYMFGNLFSDALARLLEVMPEHCELSPEEFLTKTKLSSTSEPADE